MSVASGMIFTSADREADTAKMKECRKLLEKKTGILSNYRQTTELMILSKMALSDDPEKYLSDLITAYKSISKGKFLENSYMVLAAILICDFDRINELDDISAKAKEIMKRMNKEHPMLTDSGDTSFAVLLALSYKDVDTIIKDIDECYDYLKNTCKCKASSDALQGLSEVLAVSYGDMKEKCDKAIRIFNAFKDRSVDYSKENEFIALGSLVDADLDPDTLVNEIIEAEAYLKEKNGFGNSVMDKEKRLMYAVLVVADACGGNSAIANNSMVSSTLSIIFAKRLSVFVSIITNVISAVASKKASDSEDNSEDHDRT